MTATQLEPPQQPSSWSVDSQPAAVTASVAPWSLLQRVAFRFAFSYFLLYLLPFPLGNLPIPKNPAQYWGVMEQALSRWTQVHVFGMAQPAPVVPTGSGDTIGQWA